MSDNGLPRNIILPDKPEGYKFGRPTSYRPEFCDRVIQWGMLGKSKAWMCAELEVTNKTFDNWCAVHDDFLQSMEIALRKSQQWWEDKGQANLETAGFQQSMYSRSMAARFPDDWRESSETKNTLQNADGSNIMDPLAQLLGAISNKNK